MIRAGLLRDRVLIQRPAEQQGDWGPTAERLKWIDVSVAWAEVRDLKAEESYRQGTATQVTHRVRIRYLPNLTTAMRLIHNGRVLEVLSVVDLEQRRRELFIDCRQHVDALTDAGA